MHRLRQGFAALNLIAPTPPTPDVLDDPGVRRLFEALSAHDRRHLLEVYRAARCRSEDEAVRSAALLHDVGKATLSGKRISLAARVYWVLRQLLPGVPLRSSRANRGGGWLIGPWLAEHHARIGADRLRALGMPEADCRLVELHDRGDVEDARLTLLREIDSLTF